MEGSNGQLKKYYHRKTSKGGFKHKSKVYQLFTYQNRKLHRRLCATAFARTRSKTHHIIFGRK